MADAQGPPASATPGGPGDRGRHHVHSGKVRDLYRIEEGEHAGGC